MTNDFAGNQESIARTLQASDFAADILQKYPDDLKSWAESGLLAAPLGDIQTSELVTQHLGQAETDAEWMKAARKLRNLMQFRFIYQDTNALTDVVRLTRELSVFAEEMIRHAVSFGQKPLLARYGEAIGQETGHPQQLIVLAMGKLGARELNLSSDIDLIFVYDEKGETNGRKCIDNQEYMIQWGQNVIRLLDQVTEDGFVFRVDMRLRPWGEGSALALSQNALEQYLTQHGREWERYAWIKAHAVTGGGAASEIMAMARPFVFRRYIDFSVFEALRSLKSMIEREVVRRKGDNDLKLGAGGIREIEFIVQAMQLIYGGSIKSLQGRNCLEMLDELSARQLLPENQVLELKSAYLFLRRLEHAVQAVNDQQTQNLPADNAALDRIAAGMSYPDRHILLETLEQHRTRVKKWFAEVVSERRAEETGVMTAISPVEELPDTFSAESRELVKQFWSARQVQRLPEESRNRLNQVWPLLVHHIRQASQPDVALANLIPLLESVLRRSVYLVMLQENPGALQRLVQMLGSSSWISQELARYPVLLDEFLSDSLTHLPQYDELEQLLRQQLLRVEYTEEEELLRVIRLFKKSAVLSVAAHDVLAHFPVMQISDSLTAVADVVLKHTLARAWKMLAQRYGVPKDTAGNQLGDEPSGFGIAGYGKLGGYELGYGSDLDLVFLHDIDEQAMTSGPKPITGLEFVTRVAQKLMSLLSMQTLDGRAYEIDTRLRPSGEAGLLVTSVNAYRQYEEQQAWIWEHQALVRARGVTGDPRVLDQFAEIRASVLARNRLPAELKAEVQGMREKMLAHLGSGKLQREQGLFHIKHDSGGMVDIEFLNQYAVLAWASQYPALTRYTDNMRILDLLQQAGRLTPAQVELLQRGYLGLRQHSHQLALQNASSHVDGQAWQGVREQIREIWHEIIETDRE